MPALRMRGAVPGRTLRLTTILTVLILNACSAAQAPPVAPTTPNIGRARMDIAYSTIASLDLHRVSSRNLLLAALSAVRLQATATGGTVDSATPDFQDVSDAVTTDFGKFAEAVTAIAAKNPQLSADFISDAAIEAMVKATPDCYTLYVKTTANQPTAANLESRMLAGNVGYVGWRQFVQNSNYSIQGEVRKALDMLLSQGARAWLFDVRDNPGGDASGAMLSWFLKGQPEYVRLGRKGAPTTTSARLELRLPEVYQLPIVVLLNRSSAGTSEDLALALRENQRATIVGTRSVGCVGAEQPISLPGYGILLVAVEEHVGAVTGARYHNVGIDPDIAADDQSAIDVALKLLQSKIKQ